jgi:hypothetical protein
VRGISYCPFREIRPVEVNGVKAASISQVSAIEAIKSSLIDKFRAFDRDAHLLSVRPDLWGSEDRQRDDTAAAIGPANGQTSARPTILRLRSAVPPTGPQLFPL